MDDQLGARPLDLVGGIDVGVAGERVAGVEEERAGLRVAAVSQVQHDVFVERTDAVGLRRGLHQADYVGDLLVSEPLPDIHAHVHRTNSRRTTGK
ncbi:hypothetical protein GCM10020001_054230 [Nonomuraea salmonea]